MKKILTLITVLLISITLVGCKNKPVEQPLDKNAFEHITTSNYETVFEEKTHFSLKANIPTLTTPTDETMPLEIVLDDISLSIEGSFDFSNIEDASAIIKLEVLIGSINSPLFNYEDGQSWLSDLKLEFIFAYNNSSIYSSFQSEILSDAGTSMNINEFFGSYGFLIGMFLPEDIKLYFNLASEMLIDHKEKITFESNKMAFYIAKDLFQSVLKNGLKELNEDLISNSEFLITSSKDGFKVNKGIGFTTIFSEFEIEFNVTDNKFNFVKGNLSLGESEETAITATFEVVTNSIEEPLVTDFTDYEEVAMFTMLLPLLK